jgi:uncharacterized Tic20 family protein
MAKMQTPGMVTKDEKNWALASHLVSLLGYFIGFGEFIGPLIIWMVKRNESSFVAHHAKESLNFSLTQMLLLIISLIICVPLFLIFIGIPLLILSVSVLFIWHVIAAIIGAVRAGEGELYYYPLTIRFLR